jgi:hypothetical protein
MVSRRVVLLVLSVVVLFLGFYRNQWNVADQDWFDSFYLDGQAHVIGRLVKSRQDGIFSSAGLPGDVVPADVDYEGYGLYDPPLVAFQYRAYMENLVFDRFWTYTSQIGFQGMFFSLLDRLTMTSAEQNLALFKALTSLLSALALTAIIAWFFAQFGLFVSVVVLLSTVLSPWLTVFGRNLWWSTWAFYLPMLASMYVLAREERAGRYSNGRTALYISAAMFVKCLFNGYEYVTSTLVAMVVPFVFCAVRDKWPLRKTVDRVLAATLGACGAILASLVILYAQVWAFSGDAMEGIRVIWFALAKRTYGSPSSLPPDYEASLTSSPVSVVLRYFWLWTPATDLSNWIHGGPWWLKYVVRLRFGRLVQGFLLASVLLLLLGSRTDNKPVDARTRAALMCATWFSILAPLSWFVVFKAHSDIHTHINFITWHMPFTLFGFASCGLVGERLGRLVLNLRNRAAGTLTGRARCTGGRV